MRLHPLSLSGERFARWLNRRDVRTYFLWAMLGLGPLLTIATFASLGGMHGLSSQPVLRIVLICDFVYALTVAMFVARRIAEMIAARKRHSAGSRLHMRLVRFFTAIALIPTVLVAIFATITLNFGLEGWFSDRVRDVVTNSMAAAQAYEEEHRVTLQTDARVLGYFLSEQKQRHPLMTGGQLRELLTTGQLQMQRALPKAYVIDGDGNLRARGERSYLFDYIAPSKADIERARSGEIVVIQDWENNEFRALVQLQGFADRFLYASRAVDGKILSLLDETQETVRLYQQLENDRGRLLFEFALIYLGFALVVILAAMWMGLWFAERLARPVGRLASAAERVGTGDLGVRVRESGEDDEIALLGRTFNKMTGQLKVQRDALVASHSETERRRRLFDSVLTGVTAGVIGLDGNGRIEVINTAAASLLALDPEQATGAFLADAVPEFADLMDRVDDRSSTVAKGDVRLRRHAHERDLLVRVAARETGEGDLEGYVVSFDDVTDLVVAQRMAAWGDVARRIAHEVKNPLTPIQLSAERMRRKFGPILAQDKRESLEQYVDVIVRQTNDLRRIVDEFSKFARMPAPERRSLDLTKLIGDAILLQETARPDIRYITQVPGHAVLAQLDGTMISQALTNLLKNASEAIDEALEADKSYKGEIHVALTLEPDAMIIDIEDNGPGLPDQPARLFEPYVTNRPKGTGLGLPIVKKIVEEHGGTLDLLTAAPFEGADHCGARVRIVLPRTSAGTSPETSENSSAFAEKLRERIK
ncbi:PAS domain-containing sensor histidine kinase [Rhodobacteraceae bacterium DSL-40]|uniref:sensor histidine kinase NtrY-like n=1 Tax=Amaricoccus sp. B4 TaxID=3368557 RepID=UPI000DAC534E